ncbi:3-hydroxyacyl-CoA dehydrogenase/enoyl-CoA hydratase family protein [Fulvivirga maritima]|uniref:3-hydroxyacyl-CoA dehydrogenase/enoyl-CoA hydratase family protein n=1 Tax=Fulvivirga maritima TaxID=2904247 RepID=UPI001F321A62|nr:3-hydroxyacyl-CoA dehydrogenase/enoyl-CoA hydratase family protein [Fulvivirga maritima]UII25007.1 3-hydroxyacyl-CoA dehydrogenase/enoyl-CoA hydratase family protein [Fulvivirga maritima]
MKRNIKNVAVLGSGTMGSQIACHFANIGVRVLLLDIAPKELNDEEKKKGLKLEDKEVKNRIVNGSLQKVAKMKPAPLYKKEYINRIKTGNFDDNLEEIADADWVIEAVVEKKDIKASLYEKVEKHRKDNTIVSTNTSGIPIHDLVEGRSESFKKHFLGTHFFNPPRYLELLELIPSPETDRELVSFISEYGDKYLGKTTVVCHDTPAFIGNRIGTYCTMLTLELMQKLELYVEEVDVLTGKFVGRPKSATFRTADLVGLDILADVAEGIYNNCPQDEEREIFKLPDFIKTMLENGWLGEKKGQGFYKKEKDKEGNTTILALDLKDLSYHEKDKPRFAIIDEVKKKDSTEDKLEAFEAGSTSTVGTFKKMYLNIFGSDNDKAIAFFREFYYRLFAYCSHRIPEITGDLYKVDEAIKAGYNWEYGPFEIWDILGFEETYKHMEKADCLPADWVHSMQMKGYKSFYKVEDGYRKYYDQQAGTYKIVPGTDEVIYLDNYRDKHTIFQNEESNVLDIGDDILLVEFTSKSNSIGLGVMEGINKAIDLAEDESMDYKGVLIGNEGENFSVGANLGMIAINAFKGKTDVVEKAVDSFQEMSMRIRYSSVPVVSAVHGRVLGGGAEIAMHSDAVQAAAESYIGLVEVGAGLIPGGGGTKEFTKRAADSFAEADPNTEHVQHRLMTIAQANTGMSAHQSFDLGYLEASRDSITMNKRRVITDAKMRLLQILDKGYAPPDRTKVKVLGRSALSFFYTAIVGMKYGHYITEYEEEIARKLAYVMTGGDVTGEIEVSEKYLLNLEKQAFMELVQNKKTLKRIESLLKKGKPLRN